MTLPPEIVDLSESDRTINGLLYGDSGVGKTVLAGTANNALYLAMDPGTISAYIQGGKGKLWKCPRWDDLEKAIRWCEKNPNNPFDWYIVDSHTRMQQALIRHILNLVHDDNPQRDIDIPAQPDHQKWQHMFKRTTERLISLPKNVLFIATVMRAEDSEGEEVIMPEYSGKNGTTDPAAMSHWVCAGMTFITFMHQEEDARTLLFNQAPYITKDRLGIFKEAIPITDEKGKQVETLASMTTRMHNVVGAPAKSAAAPRKAPAKKVAPGRRRPARVSA
jgi:hypothetical protein